MWMIQLGDKTNNVETTGMTMNDASQKLLISGNNPFWTGPQNVQILVMEPTTGQILDVWMYITNNGDWSTKFKKLYVNGKQYFYIGVNAYTDYIYWGMVHGGLFKVNETYGYEDGFFLGSPWHNQLLGMDLDFYENYYLGW